MVVDTVVVLVDAVVLPTDDSDDVVVFEALVELPAAQHV